MVKQYDSRTTNDIDVLIHPSTNIHQLRQQLIDTTYFFCHEGELFVNPLCGKDMLCRRPLKVDILTDIVDGKRFTDLIHYTINANGNLMLTVPMSLGVKLKCWYLRAEDDNGMRKKKTDIEDIRFLANLMRKRGTQVDSRASAELKICHYNLLLIRFELRGQDVYVLRSVGCSKFLKNYDDNTPDQRELYEAMGAGPDTDPLVVEIDDE